VPDKESLMAAQDCIDAVRKATNEKFDDEKIAEIFELLDRRAERRIKSDPSVSKEKAFQQAADELIAEKKLAALIEKRNRTINFIRRQALEDYIETSQMSAADSLAAKIYGKEGKFFGAGASTDAQAHALRLKMRGALVNDLEKAGLFEAAKKSDKDFEVEVAREMAYLNGNTQSPRAKSETAKALASIFVKHGENARLLQNDAGAYIRKVEGYVTRQSHDQLKVHKAGVDQWVKDILPLLDERTFDDVPAKGEEKFLREMYSRLASGMHLKAEGSSDFLGGFKGSANLAKKASAERVLHFKGADEWMKYNATYGRASLYESVSEAIDYSARNTAIMRDWGTNPEAMFEGLREKYIKKAEKAGDVAGMKALGNWRLHAGFNAVTGAVDVPGSVNMARIGSSWRLIQAMSKLGGVVLSSFPDLGLSAAALKHNGVGFLEAYGNQLASLGRGFKGSETREMMNNIGVGLEGANSEFFRRMHAMDSTPGTLSKATDLFFKASLQTYWQDSMTSGVGLMLSHNMARNQTKAFGALDKRLQVTLSRYGIGEKEWSLIQKLETKAADGRDYITSDAVMGLTDADLGAKNVREGNVMRRDLGAKIDVYFQDQVREALNMAGAKERTLTQFGTAAGTPLGEAVRTIMQFKTYPISFLSRTIGRERARGDITTIGHLMVATTALGYLSMTAKELAKGREPRKPEDAGDAAKLLMAAAKQGGGLGIYGDFLFGEANRVGGSWSSTLLGPTGGTLSDIERVFNAAKKMTDPRAVAFKGTLNNLPFANLFYARTAADYLFLYAMQEQLNPGFLRRYERQIERENNQKFLLPPTNALGVR
jgi:hypothetical protein